MEALNVVSTLVLVVTLVLVGRQVAEGRRAAYATALGIVYELLQSPEVRRSRGVVLGELRGKPFDTWSGSDRDHAANVCQSYDAAAIVCRRGMLPPDVVADSWGSSLRRTWPVVRPLVDERRREGGAPELWDDVEWLVHIAEHREWASPRSLPQRFAQAVGDSIAGRDRPR
jgi:hypothetical protein